MSSPTLKGPRPDHFVATFTKPSKPRPPRQFGLTFVPGSPAGLNGGYIPENEQVESDVIFKSLSLLGMTLPNWALTSDAFGNGTWNPITASGALTGVTAGVGTEVLASNPPVVRAVSAQIQKDHLVNGAFPSYTIDNVELPLHALGLTPGQSYVVRYTCDVKVEPGCAVAIYYGDPVAPAAWTIDGNQCSKVENLAAATITQTITMTSLIHCTHAGVPGPDAVIVINAIGGAANSGTIYSVGGPIALSPPLDAEPFSSGWEQIRLL